MFKSGLGFIFHEFCRFSYTSLQLHETKSWLRHGEDNRVVATCYNGTPRGITNCNHGGCLRCNSPDSNTSRVGLSTCLCLHAEGNALLEAGRSKVEENCILYYNTCHCLTCSIKIAQIGIMEVIYSQDYSMDDFGAKVFREAGIKFRQFLPSTYGTVILE